ncbi:MAG TPA: cytochrome c [Polyangiaceae bacterium]|nr:cytochrome c [Polyangiaceae bacterium]
MKTKRILVGAGALLVALGTAAGVFAAVEASAYDASLDKVYDVPVPPVTASTDPAVIARGRHVAGAIASCVARLCHGGDLGGGQTVAMGPLGAFTGPNISMGGLGAAYSDGELARLIRHGIKRDGRSVRFMPVMDFRWLSDSDVEAVVSYIRSQPAVDRANGRTDFTLLGKVLDRRDQVALDIARRVDHGAFSQPPEPAPSVEYGSYLARVCTGCHGDHFSGGRIPGTPSSIPVPSNLTAGEGGLSSWSYDDFDQALAKGLKPDGKPIDPFMPLETFTNLDETEKHALWAYLKTVPALPFGQR